MTKLKSDFNLYKITLKHATNQSKLSNIILAPSKENFENNLSETEQLKSAL